MNELKFCGDHIIKGPGAMNTIGEYEENRFFIITGKSSMFENGVIGRLEAVLNEKNKIYEIYPGIGANPTTDEVAAGLVKMKAFNPEVVVALGGGSAIDAAKVMTLLCEYEGLTIENIRDGKAPARREKIRLIAVPSTSGTASEVTRAAVITFGDENLKVGLKTEAFIPDIAILDGELTLYMPDHVMAESGMDALTHALEAYTNKQADDFTKTMARGAAEGLIKHLADSFKKGDIESRQHVHNFQCLAGFSFQNAGLGMSHGIAHAFGGRFGTSHGLLNAIALPYVLKYNQRDSGVARDLDELSRILEKDIINEVENLNKIFGIPGSFKSAGILEMDFSNYHDSLLKNSLKGSTQRNPVIMDSDEMDKVITSIYYGKILF